MSRYLVQQWSSTEQTGGRQDRQVGRLQRAPRSPLSWQPPGVRDAAIDACPAGKVTVRDYPTPYATPQATCDQSRQEYHFQSQLGTFLGAENDYTYSGLFYVFIGMSTCDIRHDPSQQQFLLRNPGSNLGLSSSYELTHTVYSHVCKMIKWTRIQARWNLNKSKTYRVDRDFSMSVLITAAYGTYTVTITAILSSCMGKGNTITQTALVLTLGAVNSDLVQMEHIFQVSWDCRPHPQPTMQDVAISGDRAAGAPSDLKLFSRRKKLSRRTEHNGH